MIAGVVDTGDNFIAGDNGTTIGCRVRLRRPEISPFWSEVVLAASGFSFCEVSMDAFFHCSPMILSAAMSDFGSEISAYRRL